MQKQVLYIFFLANLKYHYYHYYQADSTTQAL